MAIVARLPKGSTVVATDVTFASTRMQIETDEELAAGDILFVFHSSEGTATGTDHRCALPVGITGITASLNGGLHPDGTTTGSTLPASTDTITVFNTLVSGGNDLSSNATSRWLDLGYTAGGYTGQSVGDPGRNHGGIWAKVLTADDIAASGVQVEVTLNFDQVRRGLARLVVVSGASTEDADLATMINITRSSMGNTRSGSGTAYDEAEWWGPEASSQAGAPNPDPESNHHLGTATVGPSDQVLFTAASPAIISRADTSIDFSTFVPGRVISVSGHTDNNGLYVVTGTPTASAIFVIPIAGTGPVDTDVSGVDSVTIVSPGYSSDDLGNDFLAMFFTSTPPETLPFPISTPVGGGVRPPSVQADHVADPADKDNGWNDDGTYPAGWAVGYIRSTAPGHGQSCYWDRQESFTTFDGLWDGASGRFAWDYDDDVNAANTNLTETSESGAGQLWSYMTHLLLIKAVAVKEAAAADLVTASDAADTRAEKVSASADLATASDAVARGIDAVRSAADLATASDAVARGVDAVRAAADLATASDAIDVEKVDVSAVADLVTASDAMARGIDIGRAAADLVTASDAVDAEKVDVSAVADLVTASDAIDTRAEKVGVAADLATASDAIDVEKVDVSAVADLITASDAVARGVELGRSAADLATASDAMLATKDAAAGVEEEAVAELATASDAMARGIDIGRAAVELATASDAADAEKVDVSAVADLITASDAVARGVDLGRSAADLATASDALAREVEAVRAAADLATASDAVTTQSDKVFTRQEVTEVSDATEAIASTPAGSVKQFSAVIVIITGYTPVHRALNPTASIAGAVSAADTDFVLQSADGLVEETESPGNLVHNMPTQFVSSIAHATILPHVVEGMDETVDTGFGPGYLIEIHAEIGAGGNGGGVGGPVEIDIPLLISITGGATTAMAGGGEYDDLVAIILGEGSLEGTLHGIWLEQAATIDGKGSLGGGTTGTNAGPELLKEEELMAVEEVWNTALVQLGVTTVGSTGDQTPQAILLDAIWNGGFRTKFLSDHSWNGGKRTAELVQYVTNPTGLRWAYAYTLPDDYIRGLTLNGKQNVPHTYNAASGGGSGGTNVWEVEVVANSEGTLARCLLTDESAVYLEYVFDVGNTNIDLLSPMTKWAMGLALAAHAAPNFGKSVKDIELLEVKAQEALLAAKGVDGQEGTSKMFQSTRLLDCRY